MSKKAIRYNVSKKIAQLYKVIELLESTNVERDYRIEFLRSHYNQKIDATLDNYTATMEQLLATHPGAGSGIEDRVAAEFTSKYESMKADFDAFAASTAANLDQLHVREAAELESMSHDVDSLLSSFLDAQKRLDAACEDAKSRLKARVDELDIAFQEQALAHDSESQKRIETLKMENAEKLKALRDAHAQSLDALRNDPANFDFANKARESAQSLKEQVQGVKQSVEEERGKVNRMFQDTIAQVKSAKQAMIGIVKETSDGQVHAVSVIDELNAELKLMNENNFQSIAALRRQQTEEIARQRVETQKKMEEYKKVVEQNNEEAERRKDEMQNLFGRYETDAEAIAQKHREEIDAIAKKHEKEVKDASMLQERLHKDLMNLQENLLKIIQSFRRELGEEELETKRKLEAQEVTDAEHIEKKKQEYRQEIEDLERDIVRSRACGSENEANLRDQIVKMMKERDELGEKQRQRLQELEANHAKNVNELKQECERKRTELEKELKAETENVETANDNEVDSLQSEFDREYERVRQGLDASNDDKLLLLGKKLSDNTETDRMVLAFTIEYNKALETLSQTNLPPDDANKILAEMDRELDNLQSQVQAIQVNAAQQKITLIENWEMKMRNESSGVDRTSDTDDLDWGAIAEKRNEIDGLRHSTSDLIAELEASLKKMQEDHEYSTTALMNILALNQDQSQIEQLEQEVQSLVNGRGEEKKRQRQSDADAEEQMKKRIISEENEHRSRLQELNEAAKKASEEFQMKHDNLQAMVEKSLSNGNTHLSEQNSSYELDRHSSMQKFKEQMLALKEQLELLEHRRASQAKTFNEGIMALTDNFNYESKNIKKAQQEEMQKLETQRTEMSKFYDERISILEGTRDKTRGSFELMPSRESDLNEMRRLDAEARFLLEMLQKAIKELTEYKWMLTARDRDYSSRFGRGPAVGIYDARSPRTPR